ncbi:MAG: DUF2096 family protein [Candidatus Thorarchaeota archaeon]|nr:DUF2096 family protein [Candidatus Thorarchaeota archaeon]
MVSLDGLYSGWMVLNDLLGELQATGTFIPDLTFADLRNSKMVIEYLRSFEADIAVQENADNQLREEMELKILRLRETMMVWIEEKKGVETMKEWQKKFQDALDGAIVPQILEKSIPISDLPREKDVGFFRIRLPDDIPVEVVSEIAEDCGVLISLDGDRHLQVSGNKDGVRDAMKRLGNLFYGESKIKK